MMSDQVNRHKDPDVYKESFRLAKNIYQVTRDVPKEKIYVFTLKMRMPTVSIPSNPVK